MGFEWLWVAFTLSSSVAQTARNSLQRGLTETVGTIGATHVRFLYGLPFALLFLGLLWLWRGAPPAPGGDTWLWAAVGGLAQIGATALLLAAMRTRSFIVSVAYTKSEPAIVLILGAVALSETPSAAQTGAILAATAGVMLMSWPSAAMRGGDWLRPVLFGLGSGALFALASVCYRGGIVSLGEGDFVMRATLTLVMALTIQTAVLSAWLGWRDPAVLRTLLRTPRASAPAGLCGAVASILIFLAFALQTTSLVRTLTLAEILMAQVVTRRLFRQQVSPREYAGIALLTAGLAGVLLG